MTSCSKIYPELRRARPLLGTFVEITVPADAAGEEAAACAFAAIARVQALMSAHDPSSDLGRIARATTDLAVDPWTWRVLSAALRLAERSDGAFDPVAVASASRADWRDLVLLPDRRTVHCRRRLQVDLGGLAKGFAVDQAVAALRRSGLPWGLVNAGGDLRAFGSRLCPIHVRHAAAPGKFISLGKITSGAVATSAPYFSQSYEHGRTVSALRDPRNRRFVSGATSATVFAPTALAADALTKVVLLLAPAAVTPILRRYRARAWLQTDVNTEMRHAG